MNELTFDTCRCRASDDISTNNFTMARVVIRKVFEELEQQHMDERAQYEHSGLHPTLQKANEWKTYMDKERIRIFMRDSIDFIRNHAECRVRLFSPDQLRFLILLQHFVSEDTSDFYVPERERKHHDAFEGFLTCGVNAQLVKDAHRSEWSVEGRTFSQQAQLNSESVTDRKRAIAAFQKEFVEALEGYLLDFCQRREMSALGTQRLLQVVTTQMSQIGLANLDRSSQAAKYFVSGQGLDQRTAYNISTMDAGYNIGECLKLSMLCMKTGFTQYLTEETLTIPGPVLADELPKQCAPTSYLYQYTTLRFAPGPLMGGLERTECLVIDALDEVRIDPPL